MKYIRDSYGVPAKRGGKIKFTDGKGTVFECRILGACSGRLRVAVEGIKKKALILHPTWQVEYL